MASQNPMHRSARFWAVLAVCASLILILLRVMPLGGPFIFSDEYLYGAWASALYRGSRGVPPLDVALGNWLYLRVYSYVFVGAGSFLVKARVLNAVFAAMAAGTLLHAFRAVHPTRNVLLAALLAIGFVVALPGMYAGYFIPEAPYFAVTCVWLFCVVRYAGDRSLAVAIAAGVAGAVATMVKGHGFLLLPATLVVWLLIGAGTTDGWRKTATNSILVVAVWLLCCVVIGLALRNDSDSNPIGGFYGSAASGLLGHTLSYLNTTFLVLALRYAAALVSILGVPILICYWLAVESIFRPRKSGYSTQLLYPALLLCCAVTGFLLMSSVFTVAAVTPGSIIYDPYHSLGRLDGGRYYEDFALLGACVGVLGSRTVLERWSARRRLAGFVLFCALLAGSWWVLRGVGWQNPNDFAIAYGLFSSPAGRCYGFALSGLGALLVLVWPRRAPALLVCALLAWLGFNAVRTEQLRWPNAQNAAGQVAAMVAAVGTPSTSVEIVGPGATVAVYRAAFHLLDQPISFALGDEAHTCNVAGGRPEWVIALDGTRDPCAYRMVMQVGDVSAYRLGESPVAAVEGAKGPSIRHDARAATGGGRSPVND